MAGLAGRRVAITIETLPALRPTRTPWNKGRIIGQKHPLLPKHAWSIRVRLELADNNRDLALFNVAVDSKLRGCDLVGLKVNDVQAAGRVKERASVTQSKTRKPVRFEITETTRLSLEPWIKDPEMSGCDYLRPICLKLNRVYCVTHYAVRAAGHCQNSVEMVYDRSPTGVCSVDQPNLSTDLRLTEEAYGSASASGSYRAMS